MKVDVAMTISGRKGVSEHSTDIRHNVNILKDSHATPSNVLRNLQVHPWVHFACHGSFCAAEPLKSSFRLEGGDLSLLEISKVQLPTHAELAFLAACHGTLVGDPVDEVLSLAGALQFCGFRSVIGTLWEIDDEDGLNLLMTSISV